MRIFKQLLAAVSAVFIGTAAFAVPVTYILETNDASGTLDGNIFGAAEVTFTLTADTDDIDTSPGFGATQAITAATATVQLDDGPAISITSPIGLYSFGGGFGMWRPYGNNLLDNRTFALDLGVASGPTAVDYDYLQWANSPQINTDSGIILFDNAAVSGFVTVILGDPAPIPLPAAGWMLIAGVGGLGLMRKRKG